MTKTHLDLLTYKIIGAAIEVHKNLGPGLLESVYQTCLEHEFILQGINFISQPIIPIQYKGIELESLLRCDFLVSNNIVIELKSVESIKPIFQAQLLTYMKLLEAPKGILINFNCKNIFKEGQQTFVNEYFKPLAD